jgi:hypothetical protein
MTPTYFHAMTDIVVIGTHPEIADADNPRGELFGYAAYVVAEDDEGNRRRWHVRTGEVESSVLGCAEQQAAALAARLKAGKLPVGFDRWDHFHAAYGSDAHDESELIEWERRVEEGSL